MILTAKHELLKANVAIKVIYKDVLAPIDIYKLPFVVLQEKLRLGKFRKGIVKFFEHV